MIRLMRGCAVAGTIALLAAASAQSRAQAEAPAIVSAQREAAVAAIMARAARDPGELRLFLHAMPKGGDLHDHLSGALFAEDMIDWAGRKGLCVKADTTGFTQPPCAPGTQAASLGQTAPERYGRLVDSLSTRGWQAGVDAGAVDGHDQFFATFARFDPAVEGSEAAAMVALRRQAAREGVLYLELIHNPPALLQAGLQAGLSAPAEPLDANGLDAFFAREAPHLAAMVPAMRQQIDAEEAQARTTQACGTAQAEPGCAVAVHYQAFVLRSVAPAAVFRSMILAFALADKDPRFVGVNIVAPEDWPVARADYDLHMAMFRFLEKRHPGVAVSMHAGELAFGSVPPADLADHIGKAVASGARRIGHGVDIAFEDQGRATMARMAREGVAVEINLSSNAVILGVKGAEHPFELYRRHGVPVVLATDDAGVLRIDLTHEYQRAASEHGLGYADLKALSRASLEYAFLPGVSLWNAHHPGSWAPACVDGKLDAPACRTLLAQSEKARLQADLERRFASFETEVSSETGEVTGAKL